MTPTQESIRKLSDKDLIWQKNQSQATWKESDCIING